MKPREELDQIARELVDEYFNSETQSLGWLQAQIVQALSRVQDEALKEAFPVLTAQLSKANHALKQVKVSPQDSFQMGRQEGIVEALANMKPAPQGEVELARWKDACGQAHAKKTQAEF